MIDNEIKKDISIVKQFTTPEGIGIVAKMFNNTFVEIKPKDVFKHFKGNHYTVDGIYKHTETNELLVAYKNKNGSCYVRSVSMFLEYVNKDVPRFEKIVS